MSISSFEKDLTEYVDSIKDSREHFSKNAFKGTSRDLYNITKIFIKSFK